VNKHFVFDKTDTNPTQYYWFKNGFSPQEVADIVKGVKGMQMQRATIVGDDKDNTFRRSNIAWITQDDNWHWLYDKLKNMITEANDALWKFDLQSMPEGIQYTEYDGREKGHYDAHQDIGPGILSWRKVSITVQLSDPSEYTGGDFHIITSLQGYREVPKGLGNVTVFPSYMLHRVTPVTEGLRKVLVLWAGGDHYR